MTGALFWQHFCFQSTQHDTLKPLSTPGLDPDISMIPSGISWSTGIALSKIYETIHRGVWLALHTCFMGRICTASSRLNYKDSAGPQAAIEVSLRYDFLFFVYAWETTTSTNA